MSVRLLEGELFQTNYYGKVPNDECVDKSLIFELSLSAASCFRTIWHILGNVNLFPHTTDKTPFQSGKTGHCGLANTFGL